MTLRYILPLDAGPSSATSGEKAMRMESSFTFQAAHHLPGHPGPCDRLHGHGYRLTVAIEGPVSPKDGMVMDFGRLDAVVEEEVVRLLDHRNLNDILDRPTSENLARWVWLRLKDALPGLVEVRIEEEPRHAVILRGEEPEESH